MREQEVGPLFHRRSIRMQEYDYSAGGGYFITLVTHQREHLFGCVVEGEMRLNAYGKIVREEWLRSSIIRKEIELDMDEFVVMPNHIHGIVYICENDRVCGKGDRPEEPDASGARAYGQKMNKLTGKGDRPVASGESGVRAYGHTPLPVPSGFRSPSKTLGSMIRGYKIAVTTRINALRGSPGQPVWLRNYYDHIIRSEKDYENVVNYIYMNPLNWDVKDEYYH